MNACLAHWSASFPRIRKVPSPMLAGREKNNGELLAAMLASGWEVLITVDQNLRYQQNLSGTPIAILVLVATTNRLADLLPLVPAAEVALQTIQGGQIVEVSASP